MEGEVAEVVQADDKLFYLEKDGTDDHALTVKEEITLKAHSVFKYNSSLFIKILDETAEVPFIPETDEEGQYFCVADQICMTNNNTLNLKIYNVSDKDIVLKPGTIIGHFWFTIFASFIKQKEIPSYYTSDFLDVKELKKGTINKFTYVIDEKGFHKLVFLLNRHLFEGNLNSEIPLTPGETDAAQG